ncbi:MAG: tetratricopeptide repeat protein [Phycisphaerae bacterium]
MPDERIARAYELLEAALDLATGERAAFLDRSCGDDRALRGEVESLLAADAVARTFLEPPTAADLDSGLGLAAERLPTEIGGYRIERIIGSGGMGRVYQALQEKPRRTVALKVMQRGITSRSAQRRFEFESQTLAHLRHPNIAQVYEAGTHDEDGDAVPYFVMEYIPDAMPMTEYAARKILNLRQRLEILVQVCDAVHHGHQKGIIHRDLKPANILVDPAGRPRIIDFGVARGTDADLAQTTLNTGVGMLVGTLQYMSPEQCLGDPNNIDTRSDVYALGVVLYELLCGHLPYDLSRVHVAEATRIIREREPMRPSTANQRLPNDLETIALKALQKDRDRRYRSAAELGDDIKHFLNREPILARPSSFAYQLSVFARRNRAAVIAALVMAISLVAATAISIGFALRETEQRELAEIARHEAEVNAQLAAESAAEATRQANTATAINSFLEDDLLSAGDPMNESNRDITVREVMDQASQKIEGKFPDDPLVEAGVRKALGLAYKNLGEFAVAESHLERSLELTTRHSPAETGTAIDIRSDLAILYLEQGRVQESEKTLTENLERLRIAFGENDKRSLLCLSDLGYLYYQQMKYQEAEEALTAALSGLRRVAGDGARSTRVTMGNLAAVYKDQGRLIEALALSEEVIQQDSDSLGDRHPNTMNSMHNLASIYESLERFSEAEALYTRTLNLQQEVLGDEHPLALNTMSNLAFLYGAMQRAAESEELYIKVLEARRRVLGESHPDTLISMNNLAGAMRDGQRWDQAESLLNRATSLAESTLPADHPYIAIFRAAWGQCLMKLQRLKEAEVQLTRSYEQMARVFGPSHFRTVIVIEYLIELHRLLEDNANAEHYEALLTDATEPTE